MSKSFLYNASLNCISSEFFNNKNDISILSKDGVFDFFDKKKLHFNNLDQPYQFFFRFNYSYDCFLLAMHYNLYLTYYVFYLNFGSGIKTRTKFPIYKFYR